MLFSVTKPLQLHISNSNEGCVLLYSTIPSKTVQGFSLFTQHSIIYYNTE